MRGIVSNRIPWTSRMCLRRKKERLATILYEPTMHFRVSASASFSPIHHSWRVSRLSRRKKYRRGVYISQPLSKLSRRSNNLPTPGPYIGCSARMMLGKRNMQPARSLARSPITWETVRRLLLAGSNSPRLLPEDERSRLRPREGSWSALSETSPRVIIARTTRSEPCRRFRRGEARETSTYARERANFIP